MRPPAAADGLTNDELGDVRDRSSRRLEKHTVVDEAGRDLSNHGLSVHANEHVTPPRLDSAVPSTRDCRRSMTPSMGRLAS